jgi:hypothetical protein
MRPGLSGRDHFVPGKTQFATLVPVFNQDEPGPARRVGSGHDATPRDLPSDCTGLCVVSIVLMGSYIIENGSRVQ